VTIEQGDLDTQPLFDPGLLAEPYDYWRALRNHAPVHSAPDVDFVILSRYEDVIAALRDPETFSNRLSRRFDGGLSRFKDSDAVKEVLAQGCPYVDAMAFTDDPVHARHRKMVMRGFSVRRVRQLEATVAEIAKEMVDGLPLDAEVDLWSTFCVPLPIRVMAHILGVENADVPAIKRWADAQVARFGEPRANEEENLAIARTLVEFHQYLVSQIESRQKEPRDDFLTDLVQGSEGSSMAEMVNVCAQLLVAGAETTASLIGSLVKRLVGDADLMSTVRADGSLLPGAVEEALRRDAPIKLVYRITTRDVEVRGTMIPENTIVLCMIASANVDEDVFPDGDRFDILREDAAPHLAFSLGLHFCAGAALARAEARIALETLFERCDIRSARAEPPHYVSNLTIRALHELPVVLTAHAAGR
jgi:hypothetical protein